MIPAIREIGATVRLGHALLSIRYYRWALESAAQGLDRAHIAAKQAHAELVINYDHFPPARSVPEFLQRVSHEPTE